jgi:hypothetical protein
VGLTKWIIVFICATAYAWQHVLVVVDTSSGGIAGKPLHRIIIM